MYCVSYIAKDPDLKLNQKIGFAGHDFFVIELLLLLVLMIVRGVHDGAGGFFLIYSFAVLLLWSLFSSFLLLLLLLLMFNVSDRLMVVFVVSGELQGRSDLNAGSVKMIGLEITRNV